MDFCGRMTRNSDCTRFPRVDVLTVTPPWPVKPPAVLLQYLQNVSDLHIYA